MATFNKQEFDNILKLKMFPIRIVLNIKQISVFYKENKSF